ncbi:hypothetical protein BHM03_00025634 [Ensete ventricosum]|nr:hypothetical protein BHM03_00025634 [Ensete ventricosum]
MVGFAEMVNMSLMRGLPKVRGGRPGSASLVPANTSVLEHPGEPISPPNVPNKRPTEELTDQRKKSKVSSRHRSHRGGGDRDRSESRAAKGKEPAAPTEGTPIARVRPRSMKELFAVQLRKDVRDYHAIRVSERLECASDTHLEINLAQLAPGEQICLDGEASATYVRATQIPRLVGDMYTLPSKVLMARAMKALVLVSQLADTQELLADYEGQLRNLRTQVRQIEDELLNLTWAMDALRVDLPKQAIKEYKKSPGFEMGLVRIGRVFLEYGYQLVLAQLGARHPGVKIEEDPFTLLPEDADIPMTEEEPFDDSPPPADG